MLQKVNKRSSQIKELYLFGLHKVHQYGVGGALRRGVAMLKIQLARGQTESAFDREFGTDTGGLVSLWKLQIDSPHREHGFRYQASDPDFVRTAIESLPIRLEEFVYVDMGSGKGRTLLVASEYPFRRVIGVEFAAELNAIAIENIRKYRSPRRTCSDVSSICADAATWELPTEDAVFFLYNSFGEDVLRRVLRNLRASLTQTERRIYIVYSNPQCAQLLDDADFLERIEVPIGAAVYRHV